jgi:glycosyltransferase involved in cell wall biosynthesis
VGLPVTIDAVVPARDEASTVAANVAAAAGCRHVREVIVVDDGSTDGTGEVALTAGAKVIRRDAPSGSKAHAMAQGVAATDADSVLFVDADCIGLTAAHLDEICEPYVAGRAAMSIGIFDYGPIRNPVVLRLPSISGERVIPRWIFESVPPDKLAGWTIETRINEVVALNRLPTTVRTMRGVYHRTKRDKFGTVEGVRRTLRMFSDLFRMLRRDILWRTYLYYLRRLTVEQG